MSLLKYTTKYTLIGLLGLLVIIAIIGLILSQRGQKEAETPLVSPDTLAQSPVPSGIKSPSVDHFHGDGTWHADTSTQASRNGRAVPKGVVRTQTGSSRTKAAPRGSLGWITWKFGNATGTRDYHYRSGRLPDEIKDEVRLYKKTQSLREELCDWFAEMQRDIAEMDPAYQNMVDLDVMLDRKLEMYESSYDVPNLRELLLDAEGNPVPPLSDVAYKAGEFRELVGDRNLEEATQFLEHHDHYYEPLLSRLDDERAFEYLYKITSPNGSGVPGDLLRVYAERVVASDPDNLKARLYLLDTSPRSSVADCVSVLSQYESILVDYPDSPQAFVEAAPLLVYLEKPLKAIEYLKKGHELGARAGFFEAGIAYQQLGDYKTAWVYMNKANWLPHGHLQDPDEHLRAIEEGRPIIKPLPVEKLDFPETGSVPASDPDSLFGSTENPDPFVPSDVGFSDAETASRRAEAEARAKAEAARREEIALMRQMSEQEIDDFIQWAEQLMLEEAAAARTTDFLAQEMAAHLTGTSAQFSPERIVRANEMVQQYGTKEGLQRLKISDPEIAVQIQLLQNQEPIPRIED